MYLKLQCYYYKREIHLKKLLQKIISDGCLKNMFGINRTFGEYNNIISKIDHIITKIEKKKHYCPTV